MMRAGTAVARTESPIQVTSDKIQNHILYREVRIPIETSMTVGMDYGVDIPAIRENIFEFVDTHFQPTSTDTKALLLFCDLERSVENVMENFEDIRDRQIFFFEFKEKLNELWKISTGDDRKAVLRLESAIKNLKSEKLTEGQVGALGDAISILRRTDRRTKQKLQEVLLDAGIFTTPVIEGLTEMYVDEHD